MMLKKLLKPLLKLILPKVDAKIDQIKMDLLEHLFGKSKRMRELIDYVQKPNPLDMDMIVVQKQIKDLTDKIDAMDRRKNKR